MPTLKAYHNKGIIEVGCDEAGRGCLAGPVVAAAVILPSWWSHPLLNDSKQLTEKQRAILRPIIEDKAIAWAVATAQPTEIDEINILNASILAMHRALDLLKEPFEWVLVDGNRFKPYQHVPHSCIVKGDAVYRSIAAASVLAKTHRDEMMEKLHVQWPHYSWIKNKGYPTQEHRDAIRLHGPCQEHRFTFTLLTKQMELSF